MKRVDFLSVFIILLLLVTSCSPSAHIESDPSANLNDYKTYAWVDTRETQDNASSSSTDFARLGVQNAVNEQLRQKGWKLADYNPDALLSFDILVERDVEQRSDPVYTRPFSRVYYNRYFNRWGTIYFPSRFVGYDTYRVPVRKATLTINVTDAKTDKMIWQGWSTQNVNSRRLSEDEIRSSVRSILRKFNKGRR